MFAIDVVLLRGEVRETFLQDAISDTSDGDNFEEEHAFTSLNYEVIIVDLQLNAMS
jgi:hypothetical protein